MKTTTKIFVIIAGCAIGGLSAATLVYPVYAAIFSGGSGFISLVVVTLTGISLAKGE